MITLLSPAKINWFLYVTGKRPDDFHNIFSMMQCISLYDTLTFDYSKKIELVTNTEIPTKDNLVYKAAALLQANKRSLEGSEIHLTKNIPVQAGLGGGSSNAAYTLIGLNKLWDCGFTINELSMMASELGSDIPFFIHGNFGFVEGRGEFVKPLTIKENYDLLLIKPPFEISTGWAYKKVSNYTKIQENNKLHLIRQFHHALNNKDFKTIKGFMKNDIEDAVKREFPLIEEIEKALTREGAEMALVSGSGSALFGVFKDKQSAYKAVNSMKTTFPECWIQYVETINS